MNGRRAFMRKLMGVAAVSSSGVSVKEAAKAMGMPVEGLAIADSTVAPSGGYPHMSAGDTAANLIMRRHYASIEAARRGTPIHISSKKSWSPAFKEMVHLREQTILEAYAEKVRQDEGLAEKVLGVLTGSGDGT